MSTPAVTNDCMACSDNEFAVMCMVIVMFLMYQVPRYAQIKFNQGEKDGGSLIECIMCMCNLVPRPFPSREKVSFRVGGAWVRS